MPRNQKFSTGQVYFYQLMITQTFRFVFLDSSGKTHILQRWGRNSIYPSERLLTISVDTDVNEVVTCRRKRRLHLHSES